MFQIFIKIVSIASVLAYHGKDTSICNGDPVSPVPNRPRPNITNTFSAHIQCVIMNKNETIDIQEWFDESESQGRIKEHSMGITVDAWYSYNTNEFISYLPGSGCRVQQLSTSRQRFLMGYNQANGGKIFSAAQSLRMTGTGINEVYMGLSNIRGIAVDVWQSCQYWASMDATMVVKWYFSAANPEWDTALGVVVPVGARVTGVIYDPDGTRRLFDHWYEMFQYRQTIDNPEVFETPAGLQCPGRKNVKGLPPIPDAFSFMSENVGKKKRTVSYSEEYYSFMEKLVMYYYRPLPSDNSPFGTSDLRKVHDFYTGVAYTIDTMRGNCTVGPIPQPSFDAESVDNSHIRMTTPKEFFNFDDNQYTYQGVKTVRDIDCDSWVGLKANWPTPGINSTWQWYFATNQWVGVSTGTSQGGTLVQVVIDVPSINIHLESNVFNFDTNNLDIFKFDISQCYVYRNRRKFQMEFPGDFKSAVYGNLHVFKSSILRRLRYTLGVSALRIANLNIDYTPKNIKVTFEVLDVAPVVGDVKDIVKETPLDVAANRLHSMVQNSLFVITLDRKAFPNIPPMYPILQSFKETIHLSNRNQTTAGNGPVCEGGFYGTNCSKPCGHCNSGAHCNIVTGNCPNGCQGHWSGSRCDVCEAGLYGPNCSQLCGHCNSGTFCNSGTGICPYGCQDHWGGSKCDVCKSGYHGWNCSQPCGHCNSGTFCNSVTGICPNGCQGHWSGSKCTVCEGGYHGPGCSQPCGHCNSGTFCNNMTGICPNGCQGHWSGSKCDVCEGGLYGPDCSKPCGHCISGTFCNNVTGICPSGCQGHWSGSKCDVCDGGYYGSDCSMPCGHCNLGTICNNVTGICPNGCQDHWSGSKCDVCEGGFHGPDCSKPCGHCISGTFCNNITVFCPNGCQDHWSGSKCDVWEGGFYGPNSSKPCGHCIPGTLCNSVTGICPKGCQGRWTGTRCDVCEGGFHGPNCSKPCGRCSLGTYCNTVTGICPNGCQGHYSGSRCDVCGTGRYGPDCSKPCGHCISGTFCDDVTGTCPYLCQGHWSGSKCDVCEDGFHGLDCSKPCEHCKSGTFCNNVTGICPNGCKDHWSGSRCDMCEGGFYGPDCSKSCGHCNTGTFCNNVTGICPNGCQAHWSGSKCDVCERNVYGVDCSEPCGYCKRGTTCDQVTGVCPGGCQDHWSGSKCDVLRDSGSLGLSNNDKGSSSGTSVAIGVTVTLLVVAVIVIAFLLYVIRKRRHRTPQEYATLQEQPTNHITMS
ncbi:uncharacterized protein LOC130049325 isoform X2 [Ostrea edulis]|uniref:uncharacterized protein LOC130049325 isoform X2 n=1 Tax=Ostrea edulis TaxID=37623 RepID=UPI0024AEC933|nr:uncharacterized protein LOC130049325 isoform X2 [Ostrea edulis]